MTVIQYMRGLTCDLSDRSYDVGGRFCELPGFLAIFVLRWFCLVDV